MVSAHIPRDSNGSSILLLQLSMLLLELDILLPQEVKVLLQLGYLTWGVGRVRGGGAEGRGREKRGEGRGREGREEKGGKWNNMLMRNSCANVKACNNSPI